MSDIKFLHRYILKLLSMRLFIDPVAEQFRQLLWKNPDNLAKRAITFGDKYLFYLFSKYRLDLLLLL